MVICLLVFLLSILELNMFSISLRMGAVDRIVTETPKEIFESSIPVVTEERKFVPFFNKALLEEKVQHYYKMNLSNSCKSYSVDFYYYNPSDYSTCLSENCNAVEVSVTANIIFSFNYSKTIFYEIRKGAYGK